MSYWGNALEFQQSAEQDITTEARGRIKMPGRTALAPDEKTQLTSRERTTRINHLLKKVPEETIDDLPEGLLDLINDTSYIPLLESKLEPKTPSTILKNAINALGLLADWEWDHREIRSPQTSLPKLTTLYEKVEDVSIRKAILHAISKFSTPDIPFKFLVERLAVDPPVLKGRILADMQFYVDRPYLTPPVEERLLPLLHEFCRYPQATSIYSDDFSPEMDFRFWVFRCLGAIRRPESASVIEEFIATHKWPLEALAEAANAHWDITGVPKYVDILRKAKQQGVGGNTRQALREMEKFLRVSSDASKSPKAAKPRQGKKDRLSLKRATRKKKT
jgi:hypothetical protein